MNLPDMLAPGGYGLLFLLGMRHGLDPDHIAVIDNITFRAMEDRPKAAGWTGTLFSLGHSLSVLVIALGFGLVGRLITPPAWFERLMAFAIVGLLVWVGTLNLRGLLSARRYRPAGWRHGFVPRALRNSTHPLVTLLVGIVFGLVVDTAAQIATWGATAAAAGGLTAAALIGLSFAAGMILTDSADSLIVAHLLRQDQTSDRAIVYRRRIGWLIVAMCYGMAILAGLGIVKSEIDLSDRQILVLGCIMASTLIVILLGINVFYSRQGQRG